MEELKSINLTRKFQSRLRRSGSVFKSDDADQIIIRNSEVFTTLFDAFWVMGSFPWSNDKKPEILYNFPEFDVSGNAYLKFIFQSEQNCENVQINSPQEGLALLYNSPSSDQASFEVQYFPENINAPYIFIYRYKANPFTIPTITHNLDFKEISEICSPESLPSSEICLVARTKFPFSEFYQKSFEWILECETIGRLNSSEYIDSFFFKTPLEISSESSDNGISQSSILAPDPQQSPKQPSWPKSHRSKTTDAYRDLFCQLPPTSGETVSVDFPPFPVLEWTRPKAFRSYYPLARLCARTITSTIAPDVMLVLFTALLLEQTIVVRAATPKSAGMFVMGLHFLLRPLRWVGGSSAPLPLELFDFLYSPTPSLFGVTAPAESAGSPVYVDLVARRMRIERKMPELPGATELLRAWKENWLGGEDDHFQRVLMAANFAVMELLRYVGVSIMSDYSRPTNVRSQFIKELYLEHFKIGERPFAREFVGTQMFQVYVEQECRKKSDAHNAQ